MDKKKVVVIFGGSSPEYSVSLQSAYAVIAGIPRIRYEVIAVGITRDGRWFRYTGPAENIPDDSWVLDQGHCRPALISADRQEHRLLEFDGSAVTSTVIDIVFPVLHGRNGEDGTIQGLCELAGIPLVGCRTLSSALCMDKDKAHRLVAAAGIRVPESRCYEGLSDGGALYPPTDDLTLPLFVKPVRAGSSFGITKVFDRAMLASAIRTALSYDGTVLVEEAIDGFEVGCAVLGNDILATGRIDEIELQDGFFDYEEKYTLKTSRIHMPARIDTGTEARIKDTAERIYRTLGCTGFARVDMFLTPAGEIVFNEVNTIPGFTAHSRFPLMMQGAGFGFPELLDRLITLGFQ
jgi:D-alanine---D-serine ligase